MKQIKLAALAIAFAALASCAHVPEKWVDFETDWSDLDPKTSFVPFEASSCYLTEESINDCALPGGGTVGDGGADGTKTSSIYPTTIGKEIISLVQSSNIKSYCGTYWSVDQDGRPVAISGRILVPADGKVSRVMVVGHFTIGNNLEAPSLSFPLEGIFAGRGLAVVISDYIGYGTTVDRVHPYLCNTLTARNVVDMYYAALPFLDYIGCTPKYDDIYIMGYSQGGATAIAVQDYIEKRCDDIKIRLNMAGGGPYDITATFDKWVENDFTDYPCAIPMVIYGLEAGEHLQLDYSKVFLPRLLPDIYDWINSKKYYMHEVTMLLGTKKISDIITEDTRNKTSEAMGPLYYAMQKNSMTYSFNPVAPLYLFHSIDDNVVPFVNAVLLREALKSRSANVTYNFGNYGAHSAGFIRFLATSIGLLETRGDI